MTYQRRSCASAVRGNYGLQRDAQCRGEGWGYGCDPGHRRPGHLGIQYARQMGFRTIAIGRGGDKESRARKLGAHEYVDTSGGPAAQSLQKLGGAHVIVATAPDSKSTSPLIDGLAPNGKLVIIGAGPESLIFTPMQVMTGRRTVRGWTSGTAKDSEDTLRFSSLTGVRPVIERYPLEQAAEAYERMHSGKARFRVVLTMGCDAGVCIYPPFENGEG